MSSFMVNNGHAVGECAENTNNKTRKIYIPPNFISGESRFCNHCRFRVGPNHTVDECANSRNNRNS